MTNLTPSVLSIAGSDSGAGAGIQADLKICASIGVHCATAITSITAQNTQGVVKRADLSADILGSQIDAVMSDMNIRVFKIGMLGSLENVSIVCDRIERYRPDHVIIDPIINSSHANPLLSQDALSVFKQNLLPLATLLTPNLHEAAALLERTNQRDPFSIDVQGMRELAKKLIQTYQLPATLIKGGHLLDLPPTQSMVSDINEDSATHSDAANSYSETYSKPSTTNGDVRPKVLTDVLAEREHKNGSSSAEGTAMKFKEFQHPIIDTRNTHGTGCSLASAVAAYLCLGQPLTIAVEMGIRIVQLSIQNAVKRSIGQGNSPLVPPYPQD